MGPESKQAVIKVLGGLLVESRQQRETLAEIKSMLAKRGEDESADLLIVNRRLTALEKVARGEHGTPLPAE